MTGHPNPTVSRPGPAPIRRCPPTPSGCSRGSARPGPSAATGTNPSPPRAPGRPLRRHQGPERLQPSTVPVPRAHRRAQGRRGQASHRHGGAPGVGASSEPPTATTRVRGPTTRPPRPRWPGPWRPTWTTSTRCRSSSSPAWSGIVPPHPIDGASIYPACQNLLLAARALGYGGVMTSWNLLVDAELRCAAVHPRRGLRGRRHHPRPPAGPPRSGPAPAVGGTGLLRRVGSTAPFAVDPPVPAHGRRPARRPSDPA